MSDNADAVAAAPIADSVAVPAPARPQSMAEWVIAEGVAAAKELAPYALVGLVVMGVTSNANLSPFAIHITDLVIGAALLAISPTTARK